MITDCATRAMIELFVLLCQVVQTQTFDPYEALVDMGTSELVGVGQGSALLSTTPVQDDPQQGLFVSFTHSRHMFCTFGNRMKVSYPNFSQKKTDKWSSLIYSLSRTYGFLWLLHV